METVQIQLPLALVRQIQQERLIFRLCDEVYRFLCVLLSEESLIDNAADNIIIAIEMERFHIIAVKKPEVAVEAVSDGAILRSISKVPLPYTACSVAG